MDYLTQLISHLERQYAGLGVREVANGTRLIGHVPQHAPEAYLFSVFPGLNAKDIRELTSEIGRPLPRSLEDLYSRCNGIHLFAGSLSLAGLRDPFLEGEAGDRGQPFSAASQNVDERPSDAADDCVFFGFYEWDGSVLYTSSSSPQVVRCSRDSAKPLNKWPSVESALVAEVKRLEKLFDENGVKRDNDTPTAPDPLA